MTLGALGPGFNSDLKTAPPTAQEGHLGLLLKYQLLSSFSNFSISVANLFSPSTGLLKLIRLQEKRSVAMISVEDAFKGITDFQPVIEFDY